MDLKEALEETNQAIKDFFSFLGGKLGDFPNLSWGEKIAYIAILLGAVLMITAVILWLV
jgi:hypothetical protein